MATGQSLLDRMELLFPEQQLQSGESDVTKGLLALNMAQDYLESVLALHPEVLLDTDGTVTTTANTEKTAFPTGLLRLDKMQFLDATTSRPVRDLKLIRTTGGHAASASWPMSLGSPSGNGAPYGYYTNGRSIYWDPLPNATHTCRWYGFQAATDITAAGAFLYPDICLSPLATFAVRIIRTGLDDATEAYLALAEELFVPVVAVLKRFRRENAPGLSYTMVHDT